MNEFFNMFVDEWKTWTVILVLMLISVAMVNAQFGANQDFNMLTNDIYNATDINATRIFVNGVAVATSAGTYDLNITNTTDPISITESEVLNILSGNANCTIGTAGNNITITCLDTTGSGAADQNLFETISSDGTSHVADSTTDTFTLNNGSGISFIQGTDQVTVNLTDGSSQASVDNSGDTFIQDVTLDDFGFVTSLTSAAISAHTTDTDSNASTACDDDEVLDGNGDCVAFTALNVNNSLTCDQATNATAMNWDGLQSYPSACTSNQFLTTLADSPICAEPNQVTSFLVTTNLNVSQNITLNGTTINNWANADVNNSLTANALNANGGNCASSQAPLGVDELGAVESCTDFEEELDNEAGLYAALSDVSEFIETSDAATLATLDTGQGANELYAMDQDVQTSDTVRFADTNVTARGYYYNGTSVSCIYQNGTGLRFDGDCSGN